ncbi:DUF1289 domain-containing protein [Erwinia pyrifoliae]|uniref:DUF1289 domain-containing protein n=1 Tax=Erwinia pyrifoliae TaxID=79967 RepID=A0ABY5XCT5_ERWPY|nr:DUF1289 domain-containing protein [Erwinia pyrifoliae]AUX72632.1 DUF1289 domain-containing protein [Erwinia pyrifoliae]MCA8877106.1 DUF1289 domain-containing protein [Erwinia pyrifoliae]MCT2387255.1 DUF1289 domain-containing protein [Erwinia pyrifoliae]MCU8587145.1 DUF1289 domain-containing protein [Erwinia pyrifoliae]UWS35197.1 DUF1289 domain-containing protein [Erwinia pyrifoliae]
MAEQLEFFPLSSPCKGMCEVNERGYCRGCWRSREERFSWMTSSDTQKREILRLCCQRQLRQQRVTVTSTADEPYQPTLF